MKTLLALLATLLAGGFFAGSCWLANEKSKEKRGIIKPGISRAERERGNDETEAGDVALGD